MKKLPLKNNLRRVLAVLFLALMTTAASFGPISVSADQEHSDVAGSGETVSSRPVGRYGMTPISGSDVNDGTYDIDVDVSSQFFRIDSCKLTVKDGKMTAAIQLDTFSYSLIYNGTGKEAAKADASDYIEIIEDKDPKYKLVYSNNNWFEVFKDKICGTYDGESYVSDYCNIFDVLAETVETIWYDYRRDVDEKEE